jgi:hypothetical protein
MEIQKITISLVWCIWENLLETLTLIKKKKTHHFGQAEILPRNFFIDISVTHHARIKHRNWDIL